MDDFDAFILRRVLKPSALVDGLLLSPRFEFRDTDEAEIRQAGLLLGLEERAIRRRKEALVENYQFHGAREEALEAPLRWSDCPLGRLVRITHEVDKQVHRMLFLKAEGTNRLLMIKHNDQSCTIPCELDKGQAVWQHKQSASFNFVPFGRSPQAYTTGPIQHLAYVFAPHYYDIWEDGAKGKYLHLEADWPNGEGLWPLPLRFGAESQAFKLLFDGTSITFALTSRGSAGVLEAHQAGVKDIWRIVDRPKSMIKRPVSVNTIKAGEAVLDVGQRALRITAKMEVIFA